ncbi:MAG: sigma 54-interacting transcriptional regulator [Acidobacteriaceae bacterium]|nr:sigma 54-interacting transcriptional regulator [Acidobacteriaceae bacterium]
MNTPAQARTSVRRLWSRSDLARNFVPCLMTLNMVASAHCVVLIQGETGTGKEVVARAIHEAPALAVIAQRFRAHCEPRMVPQTPSFALDLPNAEDDSLAE